MTAVKPWRALNQVATSVKRLNNKNVWLWSVAVTGLLIFGWLSQQPPAAPFAPGVGIDQSSWAALFMAAHENLTAGRDIIFTYGPLGFLNFPGFWYPDLGMIAIGYYFVARLALCAVLFTAARRSFPAAGAWLLALVVVGIVRAPEPLLSFGALMIVLDHDRPRESLVLWTTLGVALYVGFELVLKVSYGIESAAMLAVFVLAVDGRTKRLAGVAVSASVAGLLVSWCVAGQNVLALPTYLRNSQDVVSGYATAFSLDQPGLQWQHSAACLIFVLGLFGVVQGSPEHKPRLRVGLAGLWVLLVFYAAKEGFLRHDAGHAALLFGTLLAGALVIRWKAVGQGLGLAVIGIALVSAMATIGLGLNGVIDPLTRAKQARSDLGYLVHPAKRETAMNSGRAAIRAADVLDAEDLALVRGDGVQVFPSETAAVWAYNLKWAPLPVFQTDLNLTTHLDDVDAQGLMSARAPQRILVQNAPEIDGRVFAFDGPATMRAMLCRYVVLRTTATWLVLARGANRCGRATPLITIHANFGQAVPVPAPPNNHTMVTVQIYGVQLSPAEQLRAFAYRSRDRDIFLNGVDRRLVPGTASDGLILRAPSSIDFPAPYNLASDTPTVAVTVNHVTGHSGLPVTYKFSAVPVSGSPEAVPAPTSG